MTKLLQCGLVALLGATFLISTGVAQDDPPSAADQEAMMAKWMEFMTPNENHERLHYKVGKWNMDVKIWMDPSAPPEVSEATTEFKMIMDGRYLIDHTKGTFQGQPFAGMGLSGYDNGKKKYVTQWIDNFGTGFMLGEGEFDEAKQQWNYTATATDPMTGTTMKTRSVERIVDEDTWVMQSYMTLPDGNEAQSMEITYRRQK